MSNRVALSFDELNSLSRSEYEEYFDEMGIPKDAKEDRVLMAMAFEDRFLPILAFVEMQRAEGRPYLTDIIPMFEAAFLSVALTRSGLTEDDVRQTADNFALDVSLSTYRHEDDDYFTSADRAVNMAATESNAINNFGDLVDARNSGKTKKTWHCIIDGHERDWHKEVNGTTLPLEEPFEVGGALMMQPLDDSLGAGADNISNCRCWLTFS